MPQKRKYANDAERKRAWRLANRDRVRKHMHDYRQRRKEEKKRAEMEAARKASANGPSDTGGAA